jgi:hypothetical protein
MDLFIRIFSIAGLIVLWPTSVHGDAMGPEFWAGFTIAGKQLCDTDVPGFKEATDASYVAWQAQNADLIEAFKRLHIEDASYPESLENMKALWREEIKTPEDLSGTCSELAEILKQARRIPGRP